MKSVYREARWAKLQEKKEAGELVSYDFIGKQGEVSYRFIKKQAGFIDDVQYYDISSYRGTGGPCIEWSNDGQELELMKSFTQDFQQYCKNNNIIAEFAKLDPWAANASVISEVLGAEFYGYFYCNDLTENFYEKAYNRRSKRAIKKAIDANVSVKFDFDGVTIPKFLELYQNTVDKFQVSAYYKFTAEELEEYFEVFKGVCFFSNAVKDGEIITSVLSVMSEDIVHYLYLGSNPEFAHCQANSLLTYQTSLLGKQYGRKLIDMGGGKKGGNIEQFKLNFVAENGVIPYYAIKKIHNQTIYDTMVQKAGAIINPVFFPLYRG